MFRNPRENATIQSGTVIQPSVGRPPSPPTTPGTKQCTSYETPSAIMTTRAMSTRTSTAVSPPAVPSLGRGSTSARKASTNGTAKQKGKPNGSILTFFKKAEPVDEELFVQDKALYEPKKETPALNVKLAGGVSSPPAEWGEIDAEEPRYQENSRSIKRRRVEDETDIEAPAVGKEERTQQETPPEDRPLLDGSSCQSPSSCVKKAAGPFVEESDSEEDADETEDTTRPGTEIRTIFISPLDTAGMESAVSDVEGKKPVPLIPPTLTRESTSVVVGEDFADFENIEDFEDDVYEEGDEYAERRWMEEQDRLEAEEGDIEGVYEEVVGGFQNDDSKPGSSDQNDMTEEAAFCPICSASLGGVSNQDAAVHVNNCLDGNPTPLPVKKEATPTTPREDSAPANRFRRQPRAAKPGQENPFILGGGPGPSGGSAFSKLMSGHAEDAAWATAAAAEHAARGKPAYQRTCPFYKILPGFNICVDAFRYGAVEGCQAYFLSHFHSDHYIGLTSSWCHGPIYCSKVTANLVKQQLRVDPKWVIDLEFEEKVEVPNTNGVNVTMIPANHCPGSSLYLYEKVISKGKTPKIQRVLHCGDFRACRAHVEHPLLRPDVLDIATGKDRQQKIDVCYLDTTYLNPKYAFPSQQEVIKACADMCVSLNKVQADENDGWEKMKRDRAGAGMVKFVRKDSDVTIKKEEEENDLDSIKLAKEPGSKQRGKLLVIVGTYSIGKERICMGIARALNSKIYAPPGKQRICAALEDPELNARLTKDPREAQVHMTPLFEIRAETLDDYLKDYRDYFTRAVGFRPSGWNYRPPNSRFVESPSVQTVLHSENWKSSYSMKELVPQRGSTSRTSCFGVPYSEHSSFRELTMFCCALRIEKIIPTVNVGSAKGREKMKGWCGKWAADRKKNGLYRIQDGKW